MKTCSGSSAIGGRTGAGSSPESKSTGCRKPEAARSHGRAPSSIYAVLAAALLLVLPACRTPDAKKVELLKAEIADLGSAAQVAGPRSPAHIARINADVLAAQKNVDEVAK